MDYLVAFCCVPKKTDKIAYLDFSKPRGVFRIQSNIYDGAKKLIVDVRVGSKYATGTLLLIFGLTSAMKLLGLPESIGITFSMDYGIMLLWWKINWVINMNVIGYINQNCHHIKTIQLICSANQLTGFYMMATLTFE